MCDEQNATALIADKAEAGLSGGTNEVKWLIGVDST